MGFRARWFAKGRRGNALGAIMAAIQRRKRRAVLAAIFVLACIPSFALPPHRTALQSGWRFRALSNGEHDRANAGVEQWHDAEVPRVVQMDLLRNQLIP